MKIAWALLIAMTSAGVADASFTNIVQAQRCPANLIEEPGPMGGKAGPRCIIPGGAFTYRQQNRSHS